MASIIALGAFLSAPKAQAAEITPSLEAARSAINNINPPVSTDVPTAETVATAVESDGFVVKPMLAETQIAADEVKPKAIKVGTAKAIKTAAKLANVDPSALTAWRFPYGYCTYYVSQKRFVPWGGNAIAWLSGARSFGFATGSTPQAGAIIVTSEGGRTGHVGYVESVSGDQVTISEMNYRGFGVISSRTISASYGAIMGYIY